MKILIVDDQFVSREKAQKILSQYGECHIAVNGKEAFEAFLYAQKEKQPFDLIVMDILMPKIDGIESLKNIREWEQSNNILFGKGVKVLMVTATDPSTVMPSFNEGCNGYITKPFTKEKLVKAINTVGFDLKELFH